jgi:hypothetical protein
MDRRTLWSWGADGLSSGLGAWLSRFCLDLMWRVESEVLVELRRAVTLNCHSMKKMVERVVRLLATFRSSMTELVHFSSMGIEAQLSLMTTTMPKPARAETVLGHQNFTSKS